MQGRAPGRDVAIREPSALAVKIVHGGRRGIRPRVGSRRCCHRRAIRALHSSGDAGLFTFDGQRGKDEAVGEIREVAVHRFAKRHWPRIRAADAAVVGVVNAVADGEQIVAGIALLRRRHPVVEQVISDREIVELLRAAEVGTERARLHR